MTTFATQLQSFADAGILDPADCYAAQRLGQLSHETDQRVWLATALLIRALRHGSVCIAIASIAAGPFDLDENHIDAQDLPWPEPTAWQAALETSTMVTCGDSPTPGPLPLRLVDGLLYLERYWGYQETVRRALLKRSSATTPTSPTTQAVLAELFPSERDHEPDQQREAAYCALGTRLTVIAGGPGTGKTTTVARLLAALIDTSSHPLHIALAAPTGKAAARLQESIKEQIPRLPDRFHEPLSKLQSCTLHRLLGWRPDSHTRFLHDATNPLPYDVIIIDECSMVALPHMARLVEALAPKTRLILVGDPFQLSSVDVGAVLADIVAGLPDNVMTLTKTWRFGSTINRVAEGIRVNAIDDVLLGLRPSEAVQWNNDDPALLHHTHHSNLYNTIIEQGQEMYRAARDGNPEAALAALGRHRILCAHRNGAYGVQAWSRTVERWLRTAIPGLGYEGEWWIGRPLLFTKNIPDLDLANGDTGIVVATDAGPQVACARGQGFQFYQPGQLDAVHTLFAMTIHKSQGSQFDDVSVILPAAQSPLLTRELVYTAITRAAQRLWLYGEEAALRTAVATPALRASGLQDRLLLTHNQGC